jgi:hypothetical protein
MRERERERERESKNHSLSKQTTPVLSRENPTAAEFNSYYSKEDPWAIKESVAEICRQKKLNYEFRNCDFQSGLDIGCGEAHLTNSLSFVKNFDAIDLSDVAIKRAKNYYPNINFQQTDIRDISKIKKNNYDFISCFETLYYISQHSEREKILIDIKNKGKDNCVFCFSVVTIGENEYRRYFTYNEAVLFFKKHFNIIHHFPIAIGKQDFSLLSLLKRVIRKLSKMVFGKSTAIDIYQKMLDECKPEDAYQCVFVLTKKLD